jgi:hypothetical protein
MQMLGEGLQRDSGIFCVRRWFGHQVWRFLQILCKDISPYQKMAAFIPAMAPELNR